MAQAPMTGIAPLIHPRLAGIPWTAALYGLALFALLSVFGEYIIRLQTARERAALESRVFAEAAAVRAGLEAELNSTIYVAVGLAGYVAVNPELDPKAVETLLPSVHQYGRHLRNIALAPDNVITYIYPVKGNEPAIGLRYADTPSQWPDVEKAMTTRQTVLSGPIDLVQGGRAMVNRTPIYLPDGRYWGVISLVIDLDSILEHVQRYSNETQLDWGVRDREKPETIIAGSAAAFGGGAVRQTIVVPGNSWEFAAMPKPGAGRVDWSYIVGLRAAVTAIAAVISVLAVLFIDLDGFKPANDRYGHRAGDHVLREIAARMQRNVRTSDMVARVGGDEFVIVLPDAHDTERAAQVARHVEAAVAEPIPFAGHLLRLTASVGTAMYPYDGLTPDELMRQADEAMYREKATRKAVVEP